MSASDVSNQADEFVARRGRFAYRQDMHMYLCPGLNALARDIAFIRDQSGFTAPAKEVDRKLLLVVSEVCEAQNELRDGHASTLVYYREGDGKPEGFLVECADAIIRLMDLMDDVIVAGPSPGLSVAGLIAEKVAFNRSRPLKHGREF